jgi:hypothetical protein
MQAGDILGDWDISSPDYLDLREVMLRDSWQEGRRFNFYHYKQGALSVIENPEDALVSSMNTTGALWLDGLKEDWQIPLNVYQVASTEVQPYRALRPGKRKGTKAIITQKCKSASTFLEMVT